MILNLTFLIKFARNADLFIVGKKTNRPIVAVKKSIFEFKFTSKTNLFRTPTFVFLIEFIL
jgi:hypothetical protein